MLIVVIGGSGSGKSEYAEQLVLKTKAKKRYYVATMLPFGEEAQKRIKRHQKMRKEKQFHTIESPFGIKNCLFDQESVVLVECMSNLVANLYFTQNESEEYINEAIIKDIKEGKELVKEYIVVTNDIFSDGIQYEKETEAYRKLLSKVNQQLVEVADIVIEVVYGIPIKVK